MNDDDLELLSAYIDSRLAADERGALEQRLDREPALRGALEELRGTVALLRELEPLAPPRSFALDPAAFAPRRAPLFGWLRLGATLASVLLALTFAVDFVGRGVVPASAPLAGGGATGAAPPQAQRRALTTTEAPAAAAPTAAAAAAESVAEPTPLVGKATEATSAPAAAAAPPQPPAAPAGPAGATAAPAAGGGAPAATSAPAATAAPEATTAPAAMVAPTTIAIPTPPAESTGAATRSADTSGGAATAAAAAPPPASAQNQSGPATDYSAPATAVPAGSPPPPAAPPIATSGNLAPDTRQLQRDQRLEAQPPAQPAISPIRLVEIGLASLALLLGLGALWVRRQGR